MKLHLLLGLLLLVVSLEDNALATTRTSGNNTIKVYAQSLTNSDAHFIESQDQTWTNCSYNRAYIDPADKELFAKALTAEANATLVAVAYDDAAATPTVPPHGVGGCRVISIW